MKLIVAPDPLKVLSVFEINAHPQSQATRTQSSLNILDSIIRALTLTHLDSDNPATSRFARNGMPAMDARSVTYFPRNRITITAVRYLPRYPRDNMCNSHTWPSSLPVVHPVALATSSPSGASGQRRKGRYRSG
jgi:hypothetical protein